MKKLNKKHLIILAIISALVVAITLCVVVSLNHKNKEIQVTKDEYVSSKETDLKIETIDTSGISLFSTPLSSESYEMYGVESNALTASVINVIVDPSSATNWLKLNWSLSFEDVNSAWSQGKNVEDYVVINMDDTTFQAVVECYAPFGEPIVITANAVHDINLFATCKCNYLARAESIKANFSFGPEMTLTESQNTEIFLDGEDPFAGPFKITEISSGVSTIENYILMLEFELSEKFTEKLYEYGINVNNGRFVYDSTIKLNHTYNIFPYELLFSSNFLDEETSYNILQGYTAVNGGDLDGEITEDVINDYNAFVNALVEADGEGDSSPIHMNIIQVSPYDINEPIAFYGADFIYNIPAVFPNLVIDNLIFDINEIVF